MGYTDFLTRTAHAARTLYGNLDFLKMQFKVGSSLGDFRNEVQGVYRVSQIRNNTAVFSKTKDSDAFARFTYSMPNHRWHVHVYVPGSGYKLAYFSSPIKETYGTVMTPLVKLTWFALVRGATYVEDEKLVLYPVLHEHELTEEDIPRRVALIDHRKSKKPNNGSSCFFALYFRMSSSEIRPNMREDMRKHIAWSLGSQDVLPGSLLTNDEEELEGCPIGPGAKATFEIPSHDRPDAASVLIAQLASADAPLFRDPLFASRLVCMQISDVVNPGPVRSFRFDRETYLFRWEAPETSGGSDISKYFIEGVVRGGRTVPLGKVAVCAWLLPDHLSRTLLRVTVTAINEGSLSGQGVSIEFSKD